MSPRDFLKMCEGFNLRSRRQQDEQIVEMRLMRRIGSLIFNTNVKKGSQVKDLDKLYYLPPLSSEEKENKKLKIPTKAEMEEIASWTLPRKLDDTTLEEYLKKT